jgi:hypothetical protein
VRVSGGFRARCAAWLVRHWESETYCYFVWFLILSFCSESTYTSGVGTGPRDSQLEARRMTTSKARRLGVVAALMVSAGSGGTAKTLRLRSE